MNDMRPRLRQPIIRRAPHVTIDIGRSVSDGSPLRWDSTTATNGHWLISGPSGTGKAHQVNRIIGELARQGVSTIHVINPHADLTYGLPEDMISTVCFSESSPYGLQPLELNEDPETGGVRRRALAFVSLMERMGSLGQRQKPALYRLLVDGYRNFGFECDDPRTWNLQFDPRNLTGVQKRYPTLADLKQSVWSRLVAIKMGTTIAAATQQEKVMMLARRRESLRKKRRGADDEEMDKIEGLLSKARGEAADAIIQGMELVDTGEELRDLIHWGNADCVQSLYDRIEALDNSGIFKGKPPQFPRGVPIRDYNIKALLRPEQQLFVDCLCERIYVAAKQRGQYDGPVEVIVIDEADNFTSDDSEHIINVIINEGRKFGLAVVMAGQSFEHFSDALLTSACVKLILGVPELYIEQTRRRLNIPVLKERNDRVNPLAHIKPKQTAFAGIVMAGDNRPIMEVELHRS